MWQTQRREEQRDSVNPFVPCVHPHPSPGKIAKVILRLTSRVLPTSDAVDRSMLRFVSECV